MHALYTDIMEIKNQLELSLQPIEFFFNNAAIKSFTEYKFRDIYKRNGKTWNIPSGHPASQVLEYLENKGLLTSNTFIDDSNKSKLIYSWKSDDEYTIISGLKSDSYFAYYTSLFLHQLTSQIPKTIYLNFEHKSITGAKEIEKVLTQKEIDDAFNGSQRKSSLTYFFRDKKIILTNGKFTGKLGVMRNQNNGQWFEYTDLERTLIDIAVRPVYAGGVFEVLEAYKMAKGKLDLKKLKNYLTTLNYIYPYHQAIGFYLEKAGYSLEEYGIFQENIKFNFYLTYDIRNREYSELWKLYYPKGV